LSRELRVLIPQEMLAKRVKELAGEIVRSYPPPFTVVALLKGAFIFAADLVREIGQGLAVDFMGVRSYSGKVKGSQELWLEPTLPVKGRRILLVDDIYDTGESLELAVNWLKERGAEEVKTCVLLDKEVKKRASLRPDFVGFKIPNCFVVGYGLDLDEKFRELPFVGCLKESE